MKNVMNKNGKRVMIVVIIVFIVIILFLKMKYGTYGGYDFNRFFNQTKQEVLQKNGERMIAGMVVETLQNQTLMLRITSIRVLSNPSRKTLIASVMHGFL